MHLLISILAWLRRIGPALNRIYSAVKGSRLGKWFIFYFFFYMGGLVEKLVKLIGISFVVNKWVTPNFTSWFAGQFVGLDPRWVAFISIVRLDSAITIILSAMVIASADAMSVRKRSNDLNQPL